MLYRVKVFPCSNLCQSTAITGVGEGLMLAQCVAKVFPCSNLCQSRAIIYRCGERPDASTMCCIG